MDRPHHRRREGARGDRGRGAQPDRAAGPIVLASGNGVAQLILIPHPFWSLTVFALDILLIYGLVATAAAFARSEL
jgi:hypothetical protein